MNNKTVVSSPNRTQVIEELTAHLTADGAPGDVIELWKIQSDTCYCAYVAGKTAAKRMLLEGEIEESQVTEVGLEFAKILIMKITFAPKPPPSDGIVMPRLVGVPPGELN